MKPLRLFLGCDVPTRDALRRVLAVQPGRSICGETAELSLIPATAGEQRPDAVLIDLTPSLSGALKAIRQVRDAVRGVEVLGLVAHEFERTVREAWNAGVRGLILKAHAGDHLLPALAALSEHSPYVEPELAAQVLPAILDASQHPTTGGRTQHLTPREREIVQLVAGGRTSKEIAAALFLSPKTIEAHRASILKKLNIRSASQMVLHAVRNNIIPA